VKLTEGAYEARAERCHDVELDGRMAAYMSALVASGVDPVGEGAIALPPSIKIPGESIFSLPP